MSEEIELFHAYIVATPTEKKLRNQVLELLRNSIEQVYSDASVSLFGSCATGIYLLDALVVFYERLHRD